MLKIELDRYKLLGKMGLKMGYDFSGTLKTLTTLTAFIGQHAGNSQN
jgi:hypothetical protein